jgi:hypothetical protein
MRIEIYPEKKVMNIYLSKMKLFSNLYTLMHLNRFLIEGMPKYKPEDEDLPNGFT